MGPFDKNTRCLLSYHSSVPAPGPPRWSCTRRCRPASGHCACAEGLKAEPSGRDASRVRGLTGLPDAFYKQPWSGKGIWKPSPQILAPGQCCLEAAQSCFRQGSFSQFSSGAQSCPTLCGPVDRSMPGLRVRHQLPEFTQTYPLSR